MNARELAEALGVHESTVSRLLSGERRPSLGLMVKVRDWTGGAWTIDAQTRTLEVGRYGGILRAWMDVAEVPCQTPTTGVPPRTGGAAASGC